MEVLNVEVKSKGQVLGTVNVEEFASVDEAIAFFQKEEEESAAKAERSPNPNVGGSSVLQLINSQHRANITNSERTRLGRGPNPVKMLRDRLKKDPGVAQKFQEFLASIGLPSDLD